MLRPWGADPRDAEVLAGAWADPDIDRWTAVPDRRARDDASRWIDGADERRDQGKAIDLAITVPAGENPVIGEVGLVVVEPERGWAEIGYWLLPDWRGGGRAATAVGMLSEWVLASTPVSRLFARTRTENPAAAAVAERSGYERAGVLDGGIEVWMRDASPPDDET